MDKPVYAPFRGAIEAPARPTSASLRNSIRVLASIGVGLAVVIVAVAAIVS